MDLAGVDLAGEEAVVAALVGAEDLAGAGKIAKDETRVVLKIIHNAHAQLQRLNASFPIG